MVDHVIVATDDDAVRRAVSPLGVEAVMTGSAHRSGTERVAEVVSALRLSAGAVVVNVQGDEPFVSAEAIRGAIARVDGGDPIGTAAAPLASDHRLDPHRVKVVVDGGGRALRFSRMLPASAAWACETRVWLHLGVYAYRPDALRRWVALPRGGDEEREGLEQLRPLAHGIPIGVSLVAGDGHFGIDTLEDLVRAEQHMERLLEGVS